MAGPAGELVGRVLGGRYRLFARIGTGASAQVYLADDVKLRRRVAVKLLHEALADDEAFLRRFRAEAQAAAQLTHPHIVVVYDWNDGVNAAGDPPYLVTQYLAGGSLRAVLDAGHRLSPSQALLVGLEAARGLEFAHGKGFVHRDIKPANLLFGEEGRVHIGDFGLARALAEAAWTEPTGAVLGTARYAAPEQARGGSVDGRSDVYSLALVLVEMVTGQVPFAADTTIATLMSRLDGPLVAPPELGALGEAVRLAGTLEAADRVDATGLVRALESAARQLPRPAPVPLAGSRSAAWGGEPDAADQTEIGAQNASQVDHGTALSQRSWPNDAASPGDDGASIGVESSGTRLVHVAGEAAAVVAKPAPAPAKHGAASANQRKRERPGNRQKVGRTRRRWPVGLLAVLLLIAGGAAGAMWWVNRPVLHLVPALVGETEAVARDQLGQRKFAMDAQRDFDETAEVGRVLTQSPAPNSKIEEGAVVALSISKGPKPRIVPGLTGLTVAEATIRLHAADLALGKTVPQFHEQIAEGVVIRWSPRGPEAPRGTEIALVVSDGPKPRVVPTVNGFSPEKAGAALVAAGFVPTLVEQNDDGVEAGKVISTNFRANATAVPGTSVRVFVSKGPLLITVPNLFGLSPLAAQKALEKVGLRSEGVRGSLESTVKRTEPAAGKAVKRSSRVLLFTQ